MSYLMSVLEAELRKAIVDEWQENHSGKIPRSHIEREMELKMDEWARVMVKKMMTQETYSW